MSKPGLCEDCVSGGVLPGVTRGSMEQIGPFNTYVAKPTGEIKRDDAALVYYTDVFGLALKNNKILADMLADELGIVVYAPDLCACSRVTVMAAVD